MRAHTASGAGWVLAVGTRTHCCLVLREPDPRLGSGKRHRGQPGARGVVLELWALDVERAARVELVVVLAAGEPELQASVWSSKVLTHPREIRRACTCRMRTGRQ